MFNALKKTIKAFFGKNKSNGSKNKSKKSKMNGGSKSTVYTGVVSHSSGKPFSNASFSNANSRNLKSNQVNIQEKLQQHVAEIFGVDNIISVVFDGSGRIVVKGSALPEILSPMNFDIDNKPYTMSFTVSESRND